MIWNWSTVLTVQAVIWLIVLFEWKHLKKASKGTKITFATLLALAAFMSFINLENTPGPITFLHYIFAPLGKLMEV